MYRGYVKLWRRAADPESGLMADPILWTVWCKCLLTASHETRTIYFLGQPVVLNPGDFIFGYGTWAKHMGLSEKVLRNRIGTLQKRACIKAGMRAGRISVFSIVNWEVYQCDDEPEGRHEGREKGRHMGRHGAGVGQTIKNGKKGEKKKEEFSASGEDAAHADADTADFYLTKRHRKLTGKRLASFNLFWEAFNYRKGKAEAADAWLDIPTLTDAIVAQIVTAARLEAERRPELIADGRTPKMAQGWLTGRRYEDEDMQAKNEDRGTPEDLRRTWDLLLPEDRPKRARDFEDVLTMEERAKYLPALRVVGGGA